MNLIIFSCVPEKHRFNSMVASHAGAHFNEKIQNKNQTLMTTAQCHLFIFDTHSLIALHQGKTKITQPMYHKLHPSKQPRRPVIVLSLKQLQQRLVRSEFRGLGVVL